MSTTDVNQIQPLCHSVKWHRSNALDSAWPSLVVQLISLLIISSQSTRNVASSRGLMSHLTPYRSFRGRFIQARWPNQQCQSTEGNQLVVEIRFESHQNHSTMLYNTILGNHLYTWRKGPNVTNPICWTCKNCLYKCAADCEHCVTQSSTEQFW